MKRNLTEAQRAAADSRRAAFRKLAGDIGRMTPEARAALAAKLPVIATVEGRSLSPFNQCLIASQCPTATLVGGFRQWIKAGRCVKKGEHGLALWVPTSTSEENGGDGETHFLMGTVFDVAQTAEIGTATEVETGVVDQNHAGAVDITLSLNNAPKRERPADYHSGYYSEEFTATP